MVDLLSSETPVPRRLDPAGEQPLHVAKTVRRQVLQEGGRTRPSRLLRGGGRALRVAGDGTDVLAGAGSAVAVEDAGAGEGDGGAPRRDGLEGLEDVNSTSARQLALQDGLHALGVGLSAALLHDLTDKNRSAWFRRPCSARPRRVGGEHLVDPLPQLTRVADLDQAEPLGDVGGCVGGGEQLGEHLFAAWLLTVPSFTRPISAASRSGVTRSVPLSL